MKKLLRVGLLLPHCSVSISRCVSRSTIGKNEAFAYFRSFASHNDAANVGLTRRRFFLTSKTTSPKKGLMTAAVGYDTNEFPADFPRRNDVFVALEAVRKACSVAASLQPTSEEHNNGISTITKVDTSPVTVADFAVQALVLSHLHNYFPADGFIAEESSDALRDDEDLTYQIMAALESLSSSSSNKIGLDDICSSIDLGKSYKTWEGSQISIGRPNRVWCLDPIDGTKGFLRGKQNGGQYAIALALIEDGEATIGILGCPNLPTSVHDDDYAWSELETDENNKDTRGAVFVASSGGGCFQVPMEPPCTTTTAGPATGKRLFVTPNDGSKFGGPENGRFCIGVEKSFGDPLGECAEMAKILHGEINALDDAGNIRKARQIDSQAKHGVIARGGAEYYVRLPVAGYREWIWDQAAGSVVLQEAGGKMTDTAGNVIDFGLGAKLSDTVKGVLASNGGIFHDALVQAYEKQKQNQEYR